VAAPCEPDGQWVLGDHVGDFPVSTLEQFRSAFDSGPYGTGDGGRITYRYTVAGRLGRTSASGTYAVTVTQVDAAGATVSACTLPRTRWKVTT
jgi:hypothetical protein